MSTGAGVWEPQKPLELNVEKLRRYVELMANVDPANLAAALSADELKSDARLMQQPESAWRVAESLGAAEVEALIRFFTLAEMQLPGWEGDKQSPVIYLVRILKRRNLFTPSLRKWIKANTDNRYLPYGSLL